MRGSLVAVAAIAVTLVSVSSAPATAVTQAQKAALAALGKYPDGRNAVNRAAYLARTLPSGRKEHVLVALREAASFKGRTTAPRALSLIGMLRANSDYFAKHYAPVPQTDIADAEGVVYRYFAGRCFEFHPLANFGALNAHVAAKDADATKRLADALIARGVYRDGAGVGWEYTFNFGGGRAPWVSGMAQAVAAQAFARAAALVPEEETQLMRSAHAAFRAIPGRLLTSVPAGPWIRLYSFGSLRVLNAQLQAVVSLQQYAATAEDGEAQALAARMQRAAAATLARFDSGYWSYYALPHEPSPLDYHEYVVQLLKRLAPQDRRFADAAARFAAYEEQPPAFQVGEGDANALSFWLSKPATVTAVTAGGRTKRISLLSGWHTLAWPQAKQAGTYDVHVTARDWAGNAAAFDGLPLVRATSTLKRAPLGPHVAFGEPPGIQPAAAALELGLSRTTVTWTPGATAADPATLPRDRAVVELFASPLPADDAGRAALAQFAASIVAQTPNLRALVLTPAATGATGDAYLAALSAIAAAAPQAPLGIALDATQDAAGAASVLAGANVAVIAYRAVSLDELEQVREWFPGAQLILEGVPAPATTNLKLLSCRSDVAAVIVEQASAALRDVLATARRGAYVCPGTSTRVEPLQLTFAPPYSLTASCDRDCVYLATLDRPDGRPVVAKRGTLKGGAVATIRLPKAKKLPRGSYRLELRLVSRVNPGELTRWVSAPFDGPS